MSTAQTRSGVLSLRANFSWTMAGNVVNAACQWGVLAVLARLASPAAVGQFVLGLAITAPIMAVAMLQLRNLLVTDARGDFAFGDYFGTRLVWTILGFGAIVFVVVGRDLDARAATVVLLVAASKCADSLSDVVRGLFQRVERMNYSGISLMLRGPTALAAMGVTLALTDRLTWAVAALALVWFGTFALYDLPQAARLLRGGDFPELGRDCVPRLRRRALLELTRTALPLGVTMGIISLQTNVPRYLVRVYDGEEALGYFGALVYPMVAALMIATAMGQTASPRLARYYLGDLAAYRALLGRLVLLAAGTGVGCMTGAWLLGRPILALVYGASYADYHFAFIVLSVAIAVQLVASCGGYALTAARYIRIQVVLLGVSCAITVGAGFLLVPRLGVLGGALTVLVTSWSMLLLFFSATWWAVRRRREVTAPSQARDGADAPAGEAAAGATKVQA